ncbi:hypothetical protein [Cetobacterium sp.]|uniref:hypothetical protein n=1 Tax=Cetobacterium sp. TaxID=2071632 RepID=UPI003F3AD465
MLNIFWEQNKINIILDNVIDKSVENKVFLKKITSEIIAPRMTEIVNKNSVNLFFNIPLEIGDILNVDDKRYILEKTPISEPILKKENLNSGIDDSIDNFEIIPPPEVNIKYIDNKLTITGNLEEDINLFIEFYTAESYPDYPFKSEKHLINIIKPYVKELIITKGVKCLVRLEKVSEELLKSLLVETQPLCYFSNVQSLKRDILELDIKVTDYPEDDLKKLITEKSIVLYSKFGLLYEQTTDPLLTPLYKSIVNLYCIKDLMALGFLTRSLDSGTDGGGSGSVGGIGQIQLGNLSVKESSSSSGTGGTSSSVSSLLGTTIIEDLVKIEEEKLISALRDISKNIIKGEGKNYEYKQYVRFNKRNW